MKRTYVWDPEERELVEVGRGRSRPQVSAPTVHGDFKPRMGITDRGKWRKYERENNLVPFSEVDASAAKQRREKIERDRRLADVRDSFEHVRNQERARQRFG